MIIEIGTGSLFGGRERVLQSLDKLGIWAPLLLEGPGLVTWITVERPPQPGAALLTHQLLTECQRYCRNWARTELTWCPRKAGWDRKTGTGSLRCYSFAWGPPDSFLEGQEESHRKDLKWDWPLKRRGRNKRRKENSRPKTWITRKNIQESRLYPEDNATLSLKSLDRNVAQLIFPRQTGQEWIQWVGPQ